MINIHRVWSIFVILLLITMNVVPGSNTQAQELDPAAAALQLAFERFDAKFEPSYYYEILGEDKEGDVAVAYYVAAFDKRTGDRLPRPVDVIPAIRKGDYWQIAIRGEQNYQATLDQFPSSLRERLDTSSFESHRSVRTLSTDFILPWSDYRYAYVTRTFSVGTHIDGEIDFDIDDSNLNVVAAKSGTIVYVNASHSINTYNSGAWQYNNSIIIRHSATEYTNYLHIVDVPASILSQCTTNYAASNCNIPVTAGTKIARQGNVGYSSASHLHIGFGSSIKYSQYQDSEDEDGDGNITENTIWYGYVWDLANAGFRGYSIDDVKGWKANTQLRSQHYFEQIGGRVVDCDPNLASGCHVAGATVTIDSGPATTTTNDIGYFILNNVAPGNTVIRARHVDSGGGSKPVIILANQSNNAGDIYLAGNQCRARDCGSPDPNDTTRPSASWTSPSNGGTYGQAVSLSANASDNSSGVREVSFSAKYAGSWHAIATDTSSPYSFSWDMCASGVPNGDVELGLEVKDNAGNTFIWSSHSGQGNYHITKNQNCEAPSGGDGVYLYRGTGQSGGFCLVTQDAPSISNYCNSNGYGNDWNDQAESVRVQGNYHFVLYSEDNYGDPRMNGNFTGDLPVDWRTRVSSVRVRRTSPALFTLYDLGDYNGGSFPTDRTIWDLGHWGFSDTAESLRVSPGYEIIACTDSGFHGLCGRANSDRPDINAIAQGLRGEVSSVRACWGNCPATPTPPVLSFPANNSQVASGQSVLAGWSGNGTEYYVEWYGGGLGGTQNSGWRQTTSWDLGVLPASANPYYWRVKAWSENSHEGGFSSWQSFYVVPPTVAVTGVSVGSPSIRADAAQNGLPQMEVIALTDLRADFNAGSPISLRIGVANTTGSAQNAYFSWEVVGPGWRRNPELEWSGSLSTASGNLTWYLNTVIPQNMPTGTYTFTGRIDWNGTITSSTTSFTVQGDDRVQAIEAFVSGASRSNSDAPARSQDMESASFASRFIPNDPVQLWIHVINNNSSSRNADVTWEVVDPQGRIVPELGGTWNLTIEPGSSYWTLTPFVPAHVISGVYVFYGRVTYNGISTQVSKTFDVYGPDEVYGLYTYTTDASEFNFTHAQMQLLGSGLAASTRAVQDTFYLDGSIAFYLVAVNNASVNQLAQVSYITSGPNGARVSQLEWTGDVTFIPGVSVFAVGGGLEETLENGLYSFRVEVVSNGYTTVSEPASFYVNGNSIKNSGMEIAGTGSSVPNSWVGKNLSNDKRVCNKSGKPPKTPFGHCAFTFKGDSDGQLEKISQAVIVNVPAGTVLRVSLWGNTVGLPGDALTQITLKYVSASTRHSTSANIIESMETMPQSTSREGWYHLILDDGTFTTPYAVSKIKLTLKFRASTGKQTLDQLSLSIADPNLPGRLERPLPSLPDGYRRP